MKLSAYLALVFLLSLAVGCTSIPSRDDDQTGEAGSNKTQRGGSANIYTSLAVEYMKQGRPDIALRKIKQAVAADPNNSNAHNVMGVIYQRLGRDALAEKHYRRAVKLDKHNFYALNAYGSFLCGRKQYAEANRQFNNAVKTPLNRNKAVALTNAGICAYGEGERSVADSYLRSALSANPRYSPALAQMAEISYDLGDYVSARAYLKRFLAVSRHTAKTLWVGIRTEQKLGDRDAEASYRLQLRNRFPDSKEFRLMRQMSRQDG